MRKFVQSVLTFWHDEHAATAVEYAILAASIAVVIITALRTIGASLIGSFSSVLPGFN